MTMPTGKCTLCLEVAELRRSHAIPDSIFKRITRKNNGQAISFNSDDGYLVDYSSDSWWEYQLCGNCEQHLNLNYERYSISAIRAGEGKFLKHDFGVTFSEIDTLKLQLFFLSIFWRAANSKNEAYKKIYIPDPWNNELRVHLLRKTRIPLRLMTVKISRLIDRSTEGGFSLTVLKNVIVSPFFRKLPGRKFSFCFLFEGFFIEIFMPGYTLKQRAVQGIINPLNKMVAAPYLDIFDIPEVVSLLVAGYKKNLEGKVKFTT
jgi:hypothetical protein